MRILLVDDQRSARQVLRQLLSELPDIEVLEASSLLEAKQRVESQAPDAVLVDLRLSAAPTDRGGLVLLGWLRESQHAIPAVMVTSAMEMVEIQEALRLGARGYLLKDELGPETLLPVIEDIRRHPNLWRDTGALAQSTRGCLPWARPRTLAERARRLIARLGKARDGRLQPGKPIR